MMLSRGYFLIDPIPQMQIIDPARQFGDFRVQPAGNSEIVLYIQPLLLLYYPHLDLFDPIGNSSPDLFPLKKDFGPILLRVTRPFLRQVRYMDTQTHVIYKFRSPQTPIPFLTVISFN